jgi:secondary thiamine-phosphate synthase enzyme
MEQTLTNVRIQRNGVVAATGSEPVVVCETLTTTTTTAPEFIDITDEVQSIVAASGAKFGQVTVFSTHTTAAIKVNENEPLLLEDMARVLREMAPVDASYEHNDFTKRTVNMEEGECKNGHAHCQHLFLPTSETLPVLDGQIPIGKWQRIFLIELDRARDRRVLVNVVGVKE